MRMRLRLFYVIVSALLRRRTLAISEQSVLSLTVMPWDCVLQHMGNDRYHAFMDLGRIDLAIRLGWARTILKGRWHPQVIGCYVRYEFPLTVFDRFFLHTYIVYSTETSVWMAHQFEKGGIVYSSAISKMVAVSNYQVVRLGKLYNYNTGIRRWPFRKDTVTLFDHINTILKELHAFIF